MRRAVLLSLLAIFVAAGCKPGAEMVKFPTRPKRYRTVASLSPGSTEIVQSLAFNVTLVGRTAACDFPPQVKSVPIIAQVKPDYEKLKSLNPDLVVYDASLYSDQDVAQIKGLGMDVFEFRANTIEGLAEEVRKFGTLIGRELEASDFIDKVLQERKAGIAAGPKPAPKVAVIMASTGGEHYIAGVNSFQADLVRAGGAEPAGPEADRFVPVNAETLIKMNPDMVITAGKPDSFFNDPRFKTLKAISTGNVRGIDQNLMVRKGFRVQKAITLTGNAINNMAPGAKS